MHVYSTRQFALHIYKLLACLAMATSAASSVRDQLINSLLILALTLAVVQVAYVALVGTFPFNSFLAGFIACIGVSVFTGSHGGLRESSRSCVSADITRLKTDFVFSWPLMWCCSWTQAATLRCKGCNIRRQVALPILCRISGVHAASPGRRVEFHGLNNCNFTHSRLLSSRT